MSLTIKPSSTLPTLELGEEIQFAIKVASELNGMTISNVVLTMTDSDGQIVNDDYHGGVIAISELIYFGIKAFDVNKLKLEFIVTCEEVLPDTVTPYEFIFYMWVKIKDI